MSQQHDADDATLLGRFLDTRNDAAFTELVRRHLPLVFQVARRRLGTAALAEEAAQNTFACLAGKAATVARHPERLQAWLHRTAWFEASSLARKEARLSRVPITREPVSEPMDRPEIYDRLDEALTRLPELDRELVLRHCCGGEDYRQIAAAIGKSESACQKRVERALARLSQGMGGARTAAGVIAALAIAGGKSQAMPAAESIARAALQSPSATAAATGALSGMTAAACAVMVMAGTFAGWKSATPDATSSPPQAAAPAQTKSDRQRLAVDTGTPLPPRPPVTDRSLEDVLESIQAGRLLPLVEYLPEATPSDLRAIMAEDDLGDLTEGMGTFGDAHRLAARRWAEIQPAAAFEYGLSRSTPLAARMLSRWMTMDPPTASAAFRALSLVDRVSLARKMVGTDDLGASKLSAVDPAIAWAVEEERIISPDPEIQAQDAVARIESLAAFPDRPAPDPAEAAEIRSAVARVSWNDLETARRLAFSIPWPELRSTVLADLPLSSSDFPAPGSSRHHALASEARKQMTVDPEAVIRLLTEAKPGIGRDAIFAAVAPQLAGSDPWRLIAIVSSLEGDLGGYDASLPRALEFAGRDNPVKALDSIPALVTRTGNPGATARFAKAVLEGWLRKDPAAAIQWSASAGIWLGAEELQKCPADVEPLAKLLSSEDESVKSMASRALSGHLGTLLSGGDPATLLAKIPPPAADDLLETVALDSAWYGDCRGAARLLPLLSGAARSRELLPKIALSGLRNEAGEAVAWLNSLPPADRQFTVAAVRAMLSPSSYQGGDAEKIQTRLERIHP